MVERATCDLSAGDLYLSPKSGANVASSSAVTFKWDTTCLPSVTSIDLYLYTTAQGLLHSYPGVDYSKGEYSVGELDPRWWNYTTKASVYLAIVDANVPRWLSSVPVGPTFDVYTAKDALSTTIVQAGTTIVTAASAVIASSKSASKATNTAAANGTAAGAASDDPGMFSSALHPAGGLPRGAIAAAIVVPVLAVGLLVALYVKFARLREREKRKRWSQHVDQRMSVLSADWRHGAPPGATGSVYSQSGAAGGATAAAARSSMFSTANGAVGGAGRPVSAWTKNSSVYGMENNVAGRGVAAFRPPQQPLQEGQQQRRSIIDSSSSSGGGGGGRPASIFTVSNADLATMPGGVRTSHVSFAGAPGGQAQRQSRVSFGDALRPSRSTLSVNVLASSSSHSGKLASSGNGGSNGNGGNRMSLAETSPTAGRHSIDGAHAMMMASSRSVPSPSRRGDNVTTVSPSQAAGPFAVPAVPARARSGSTSGGGGGVAGFFSSISSAVGLKDKKTSSSTTTASGTRGGRVPVPSAGTEEWKQAEATRRSADGVRDMEAIMLRRSQAISQYSTRSTVASHYENEEQGRHQSRFEQQGGEDDEIELLDTAVTSPVVAPGGGGGGGGGHSANGSGNSGTMMRAPSPMGMMGMPMSATANPDQMLAAYAAARMAGAKSPTAGIGQSIEQQQRGDGISGGGAAMAELAAAAGVPAPSSAHRERDD
ncbi:hypothetical protein QFC21_005347 [Naganishia friedmannii]|uniref:Uncharacterized protein n=1 Tax=Naganishia friedmannii TaxID=89922 RepID=A0ACC2VAP3_9TREE|nr:hypothetical protein QFC21_005347 [Naganishia friedmannii]